MCAAYRPASQSKSTSYKLEIVLTAFDALQEASHQQHIAPNPATAVSPSAANHWNFPLPAQSSTYIWPSPGSSSSQTQHPSPEEFIMHLPGCNQEKQAANLVQAMESQAFINGDPSKPDSLELYYYRFVGTTILSHLYMYANKSLVRIDCHSVSLSRRTQTECH